MAEGGGSEAFFPTPMFNGTASEAEQVAASFPDAAEGTMLRTADEGVIEATSVGFGARLYNSSCYNEPEGEHSVITASDGSQWYQVPNGEPAPQPIGQAGEEVTFPDLPDGTAVTPAGIGMMEATGENSSSMLYNSEFYAEPEGNYELITASDGSQWYSVNEGAVEVPPLATQDGGLTFAGMSEDISATPVGVGVAEAVDGNSVSSMLYNSAYYGEPEGDYSVVTDTDGNQWYQVAEGNAAPQLTGDNVTFPEMPNTTSVSFAGAGMAEAVSEDGSTAMLYNSAYYGEPESDYSLVTASDGSQWYQLAQGAEAPQLIGGNESMTFSGASDMTVEQTGVGVAEAVDGDGESSMLYNSAYYGKPNGDYSLVTGSDGSQWFQLSQDAEAPQLIGGGNLSFPDMPDASVSQTGVGVAETVNEDGSRSVLYSSEYYGKPESGEYGTVTAADGSQWYQISASEQAEPPRFKGDPAEGVSFSGMPENTEVQSVGSGVVEARSGNENNTLWYSSAHFEEPAAPHTVIQETNGTEWYAMQPHASSPNFEQGDAAATYNQAQLSAFLPGYEQKVTSVDGSARSEGRIEVRHENGSGTMFYDTTRYSAPRGDYRVYEDVNGNQWYAVKGDASVERKLVYEDGKPVYDGDNIKTVSVDTVKYKSNPAKYEAPKRRGIFRIKPPRRRK